MIGFDYSVSGVTDEQVTFSFARNGEAVVSRRVTVMLGKQSPSAKIAVSHDGDAYGDELNVGTAEQVELNFAARGISIRPMEAGTRVVFAIHFAE